MQLPSKKAVREALNDSLFDPRQPGPLTTMVTDTDKDYLIKRTQEILRQAAIQQGARDNLLRDAVSLLAFARCI